MISSFSGVPAVVVKPIASNVTLPAAKVFDVLSWASLPSHVLLSLTSCQSLIPAASVSPSTAVPVRVTVRSVNDTESLSAVRSSTITTLFVVPLVSVPPPVEVWPTVS